MIKLISQLNTVTDQNRSISYGSNESLSIESTKNDKQKKIILHIAGSAETDYYASLSIWYAKQCAESLQHKVSDCMEFIFACIHPKKNKKNVYDAIWIFPQKLNHEISENYRYQKYSFNDACKKLQNLNISVCIHHMFDPSGTVQYRQLLIDLNIPFIGSNPDTMSITNDKQKFRKLMQKNDIPVPFGISFMKHKESLADIKTMLNDVNIEYPLIVKPCTADNSIGVSFIDKQSDLEQAINNAFEYDDCIIIENEYGKPDIMLPCIEYGVGKTHPIRTESDKLTVIESYDNDQHKLEKVYAKSRLTVEVGCKISKELREKLKNYAFKAHKIMGARDFSLYDLRIDPNGNPYFIEANLFCSFAPYSVIISMAQATNDDKLNHVELFKYMVNKACKKIRY